MSETETIVSDFKESSTEDEIYNTVGIRGITNVENVTKVIIYTSEDVPEGTEVSTEVEGCISKLTQTSIY